LRIAKNMTALIVVRPNWHRKTNDNILFVLFLILLNGVFAMSEIAIVDSRRARLVQMAEAGSAGARHALTLASEPARFLSSVQVGITSAHSRYRDHAEGNRGDGGAAGCGALGGNRQSRGSMGRG
jgi:hypothetical protein